jgi:ubiquinone/menaquinone biosynthesis C-methylase UbiE
MNARRQQSPRNELVNRLARGAVFRNGFVAGKKILPFYNAVKGSKDAGWSDEIANDLEEHSEHHFIDVYNRRIAVNALKPVLSRQGSTFLDAGCSSGYLLSDVQARFPGCSLVGADFFAAGLKHCHRGHPDIPLFRIDLTACPFPDQTFDAVACLNVLEHIKQDEKALEHLYRILKPGGILVLTVPAGPALFDFYDELHFHERRYALRPLVQAVKNASFEVASANYFGFFLYPAFHFVKKRNQRKFGSLSLKDKRDLMMKQIRSTSRSVLMDTACRLEELAGRLVPYPAGIRIYVIARKSR